VEGMYVRHDTKHIRASKKRRTSENAIWANFGECPLAEVHLRHYA
jgi:hypothetical protein